MRPLWRDLILQIWGGDPLQCPCCNGTMKSVRKVIRREKVQFFLRLHGLWEGIIQVPPYPGLLRSILPLTSSKRFAALPVWLEFTIALSAFSVSVFSISALPKLPLFVAHYRIPSGQANRARVCGIRKRQPQILRPPGRFG